MRAKTEALSLASLATGCLVTANNGLTWGTGAFSLPLVTAPIFFLVAIALFLVRDRDRPLSPAATATLLSAVLLTYLLSDYAAYKWFFWISLLHRKLLFLLTLVLTVLFLLRRRSVPTAAVLLVLVTAELYLTFKLFDATGGAALQRDDHPSFLYRLQLLRETFPQIISYDPRWNGGRIATELLQTGILTVAPFFIPLAKLFPGVPVERLYTPFLAFLFHWVFPWLFYLGLRLWGTDRRTALLGALLSLYPNRYFFINLLPWGVFPSLLAMALVIPASGALYRITVLDRPGWIPALILALSTLLASFWPASFFTFLPLTVPFLASLPGLERRRLLWLALSFTLFLVLLAPWLRSFMMSGELVKFNALGTSSSLAPEWNQVWNNLEHLNYLSPLLLVFGLPGLFYLGDRPLRRWLLSFVIVYLLFLGFGNEYKKQFQFLRLINSFSYIMIIPASIWLGRIFAFDRRRDAPVRGLALASVLLTIFSAGWIWSNRGLERYSLSGVTERELVSLLRREVPESARLFWAGHAMHGFGGGHVAPLPYLTGKMMMASDYYHFHIREIGGTYDLVPRHYLKGQGHEERTEKYFDLFNVSHIATVEGRWVRYLGEHPELYELIWERRKGDFWIQVYGRRSFRDSLFEEGSGTVEVLPGRIRVSLDAPRDEVVLRFAYLEDLAARPPLQLSPLELPGEVRLLRVSTGDTLSFEIFRPGIW